MSDHEDEAEKLARQQEVKILVKKKSKRAEKPSVEPPMLAKVKEEPIDFEERIDEPFVVQPTDSDELDLMRVVRVYPKIEVSDQKMQDSL